MDEKTITKILAAMMGKCTDKKGFKFDYYENKWVCLSCNKKFTQLPKPWSPSLDGEATKEVRDWFAKEMPEEWEKYLEEGYDQSQYFTRCFKWTLSITNLAHYIVDNYEEMFYEECKACYGGVPASPTDEICGMCHGTGKIIKPQFVEAVKIIEGEKK
jgi:hypothetical protein